MGISNTPMPTGPSPAPTTPPVVPGVIKPGWQTTEFWLTLGTFLVSGFVLTGVVSQDKQDTIGQIVAHAITSVGLVAGQAAIVYKYISGRHKRKIEVIKQQEEKQPVKPKKKRRPRRKI